MMHPLKSYREMQTPPLSQKQLARLLGVSRTTVARWETGIRKIDPTRLRVILKKTGVPLSELRPDLAEIMRGTE